MMYCVLHLVSAWPVPGSCALLLGELEASRIAGVCAAIVTARRDVERCAGAVELVSLSYDFVLLWN